MKPWDRNKVVGNIGECIIEMLIKSLPNWRCVRFGVENHIQELRYHLQKNLTNESKKIKSMPDFIAINEGTGKVDFIDVKYKNDIYKRDNGDLLFYFGYRQMKDYLEHWKNMKFIIVTTKEPYFMVIDLNEVDEKTHFHSNEKEKHREIWNFKGVNKDIKTLFPELEDEVLKEAIKLIPNVEIK